MENTQNISFVMAFIAGALVFLSPCILPLLPAYISYLTGVSFRKIPDEPEKRKLKIRTTAMLHSLCFIFGFSAVFVLLGMSATTVGRSLYQYKPILAKIGGVFIIIFALITAGIIKIPILEREKRFSYKKEGVSAIGSVLVGVTFAAAWTPCIGPYWGRY